MTITTLIAEFGVAALALGLLVIVIGGLLLSATAATTANRTKTNQ